MISKAYRNPLIFACPYPLTTSSNDLANMPLPKSIKRENPAQTTPPRAAIPTNMFIFNGPNIIDVLELALLVSQADSGLQDIRSAQSLASDITKTITATLDPATSAAVAAQCQRRAENRKLVANAAAELQKLRAFVCQEARERGTELAEEIRKIVGRIKETDRAAERDDEWLKGLELKLQSIDSRDLKSVIDIYFLRPPRYLPTSLQPPPTNNTTSGWIQWTAKHPLR